MIRTYALLSLLSIGAFGSGSIDVYHVRDQAPPNSTLTLSNHNNSNVINELTTLNNFTSKPHRIVSGCRISIADAPWQGALIQANTFVCGCSIISPIWVLTAAHCVYGNTFKPHAVRVGSEHFKRGGQLRIVDRIAYPASYNDEESADDIAILRTTRPFKLNPSVQPVHLATSDSQTNSYFISGWGSLSEDNGYPTKYLRGVNVYHVSRTQCAKAYRENTRITSKHICAQALYRDSCQGDSGGALMSGGTQYGIVSLGVGCGRYRYPGVYTNIYKYRSWIRNVARLLSLSNIL